MESAVNLTRTLRLDIQRLGQRLSVAASREESIQGGKKSTDKAQHALELKQIADAIRKLLARIEDAVPLINLAITASGASLSAGLPATISPSRLLQASTLLTLGDSQYPNAQQGCARIGPDFTLSLYMLFQGHLRPQNEEEVRETTWKEVIHKATVRLMRVPLDDLYNVADETSSKREPRLDEYAYQLLIIEDLDDDRVHTIEEHEAKPGPFNGVTQAGIREFVPIHQLSKIFYADTGKILNIGTDGESNTPVLLLKRDVNAVPPRRNGDGYDDDEQELEESLAAVSLNKQEPPEEGVTPGHRFTHDLDLEWMALEVYSEEADSEDETEESPKRPSRATSMEAVSSPVTLGSHAENSSQPNMPATKTSLSLLEMLLRLVSLQQFQQTPHLSIPDELLTFFLHESASTGTATNDAQERKRLREETRRHVGFDPYDESPVKRRGEDYQYTGGRGDDFSDGTPYGGTPRTPLRPQRSSSSRSSPQGKSSLLSNSRISVSSPLARPSTGLTDEGIGSSPESQKAEGKVS